VIVAAQNQDSFKQELSWPLKSELTSHKPRGRWKPLTGSDSDGSQAAVDAL